MEHIEFKPLKDEVEELVNLITSNEWPFHSGEKLTREQIVHSYENGWYEDGRETFWIERKQEKLGIIIIHDIQDTIPLFDLRIQNNERGRGIGTQTLLWLQDYIFNLPNKKIRIEAYTRSDNLAMRKAFTKSGFVKEGYLRDAWENNDGNYSDAICYAVIRADWENNTVTPIKIDELPY